MSQRLTKERALREITNKLETRAVSMKPMRSGLRRSSRLVIREVGPASTWALNSGKPSTSANGPNGSKNANLEIGHHPSMPPDPTRDLPAIKQSHVPLVLIPDGSRALDRDGANEAAADQVATAEMEGVEMSESARTPSTKENC